MTTELADSVVQPNGSGGGARRAKAFLYGSILVALAVIIGTGFIIKTDKAVLMPGAARETESLVSVTGLPSFASEGEVFYTTVRLRVKPSYWEYLWFQLDDEVRIVEAEAVLGDRSVDENRQRNLTLMSDSKSVAVAVALEQLGYDAIESNGVWITSVSPGEAADGVFSIGDVIVGLDGEELLTSTDLIESLKARKPGDRATFSVHLAEGGEPVDLTVTLGQFPDDPNRAFLGVGPSDVLVVDPDLDVDVKIDSGEVGGPSAGLAFTLAVLDALTEGELTGGVDVAVTGTIGADGSVGPVGGAPQKAAAVRDLGIKTFIVPSALGPDVLAEIAEIVGGEVEIIPVDDLDGALEALSRLGGDVDAVEEFAAANLNQ